MNKDDLASVPRAAGVGDSRTKCPQIRSHVSQTVIGVGYVEFTQKRTHFPALVIPAHLCGVLAVYCFDGIKLDFLFGLSVLFLPGMKGGTLTKTFPALMVNHINRTGGQSVLNAGADAGGRLPRPSLLAGVFFVLPSLLPVFVCGGDRGTGGRVGLARVWSSC